MANMLEKPTTSVIDGLFANQQQELVPPKDEKEYVVEQMFEQALIHQVKTDESLKQDVLGAAKNYTKAKMQKIVTDVDTEHKEAVFNNRKSACESYGFNETTTPIWASSIMLIGYDIMLAIWLFVGTFTFMPIIFMAKKIQVGLKQIWLAVVLAILIYACVVGIPIVLAILQGQPHPEVTACISSVL